MTPVEAFKVVERLYQPVWISDQEMNDAVIVLDDLREALLFRLKAAHRQIRLKRPTTSGGGRKAWQRVRSTV